MKEDVYQKYSPDEDVVARDKAMEDSMPTAQDIWDKFEAGKKNIRMKHPDSPAAKTQIHVDLKALEAARRIWQKVRNPYIATNDESHPNNWTKHQLLMMAGIIQTELGIPTVENS